MEDNNMTNVFLGNGGKYPQCLSTLALLADGHCSATSEMPLILYPQIYNGHLSLFTHSRAGVLHGIQAFPAGLPSLTTPREECKWASCEVASR